MGILLNNVFDGTSTTVSSGPVNDVAAIDSLVLRLNLAPTKMKTPGIDLHVISWHNDVTAKVMTQLCSHVIR